MKNKKVKYKLLDSWVYLVDKHNNEYKIGYGFLAKDEKVIVVGIRAKEKIFPNTKTVTFFALGHSILHSDDVNDMEYGVHLAMKRAVNNKKLLYSNSYSMLNNGFCQAIVNDELRHIKNNLEKYYREYGREYEPEHNTLPF